MSLVHQNGRVTARFKEGSTSYIFYVRRFSNGGLRSSEILGEPRAAGRGADATDAHAGGDCGDARTQGARRRAAALRCKRWKGSMYRRTGSSPGGRRCSWIAQRWWRMAAWLATVELRFLPAMATATAFWGFPGSATGTG